MDLMSDPNAVIVSQDEVHFQQQTTVTGKLVKRGSRPTVKSFPGKNKVSYSGFVVLGSGQLYVTKPERFNYVSTLDAISSFLDACPLKEGKTYYTILDNASWHKKAKRLIKEECLPEYDRILDSVRFLDIPPYSPDLNPIEQVWRITRREKTHNRFFASIREEMKLLDEWFSEFSAPNEKLASLCTFHFHPMATTLS